MLFQPSENQENILKWIENGTQHGCINAVAGSGKSTTLMLAALELQNLGFEIPEVKIIVFGKANSLDLISKFGEQWKDSISTLHSAGWSLIKAYFPSRQLKIDNTKYRSIATEQGLIRGGDGSSGSLVRNYTIAKDAESEFMKLLDLVRLTCTTPTPTNLATLAEHHDLNGLFDFDRIKIVVNRCLAIGLERATYRGIFDFCDQIYIPYELALKPRKPYKFVLVDECQDLNAAQLELVKTLAGDTGRILAVGDPYQAIFGFAGADDRSYQKIAEGLQAKELPLSVCYRCPKTHIQLVNSIFTEIPIISHTNAIDGEIKILNPSDLPQTLATGDLVICRKTAPLMKLCMELIAQGMAATVKGRDIGAQIAKELDAIVKMPGYEGYQRLASAIDLYEQMQSEKYGGLKNAEQLRINLEDRCAAIRALYIGYPDCGSISELKDSIEKLFSDNESPITLATCHRTKGLEADRIFLYQAEEMPLRWKSQLRWQLEQEYNLLYVALTRSKQSLFVVPSKENDTISWLPNLEMEDVAD
jgi:DNA helicase II / ATP-dependent DNA helicase PcrA